MSKKFERSRVCKEATHNPFIGLNPESQISEGIFQLNLLKLDKTHIIKVR